jgi:hypothetical protein
VLPLVPAQTGWVDSLLFVAGTGQAFFLPLLGALALGLLGHAALNPTVGNNQGWNHVGNLAAALPGGNARDGVVGTGDVQHAGGEPHGTWVGG